MIKEGKFGTHEAICLVTITITAKMFYKSRILADILGTALVYDLIIGSHSCCRLYLHLPLLKRFPGKN